MSPDTHSLIPFLDCTVPLEIHALESRGGPDAEVCGAYYTPPAILDIIDPSIGSAALASLALNAALAGWVWSWVIAPGVRP